MGAFYCNKGTKHMFSSPMEVLNWSGLNLDQDKTPDHYSVALFKLVRRMVDPDPKARPSAGEVRAECTRDREEAGQH